MDEGEATLHVPAARRQSVPSARETASARARQLLELATKQRQLLGRVLWVSVVLLCVLGCLSQVFIFLEIFWKFPTIIEVETERTDDLDFPGVTICNNNRVRLSQLCRLRGETNCVQTKHKGTIENLDSMLRTMNKSLRGEIGHQKGTMIFETSKVVNGTVEVADDQGFRDEFFHLRYSNCYSYNVEWTGSGVKEAEIARQIDLSVILFLEQQEYPRSDVWPGAQIVFHDPEVIPDPEVDGIPLRAGHNYIFTLRQMITKRLPKPYWTKCVNYPFVRREQYVMKMTKPLCEKECAYNASLLMCRCIRVDVALPYEVDWDRQPSGKRRFCDADIALTRCWVKVLDETERCQKKFCRRACLESQFETSVTQDPWPDEILFMQEQCSASQSECLVNLGWCACREGFARSADSLDCEAKPEGGLRARCAKHADCRSANARCVYSHCECPSGTLLATRGANECLNATTVPLASPEKMLAPVGVVIPWHLAPIPALQEAPETPSFGKPHKHIRDSPIAED